MTVIARVSTEPTAASHSRLQGGPYHTHDWLHPVEFAYLPGPLTPALEQTIDPLLEWLKRAGCPILSRPTNQTEVIITTARFGVPVDRSKALFFHAKRRYHLSQRPRLMTIVSIAEPDYQRWLDHFTSLAARSAAASAEYQYPGLGPEAIEVLQRQARRGGPEVAMARFLQGHVKSIQVMALRHDGWNRPLSAMLFDLAGAHPTVLARDPQTFAQELGLRLLATSGAHEVNAHVFSGETFPQARWEQLASPDAMIRAGRVFGEFGFLTDPIAIEKITGFRSVSEAISAQYSEGCFATYEPEIPGLIVTASGSSRLVDKRRIQRSDQAIVVGVKPERDGAIVRPIAGLDRVVPSVEAVELMSICQAVPTRRRSNRHAEEVEVPVARSILHGHIGVAAYDPARVESVQLDEPYYRHLVSCGTGVLAEGTSSAFSRSSALNDPDDPRLVVFLEQPGHGVVVVEKWVEGRQPFEVMRDCLASGDLQASLQVPQGWIDWELITRSDGRRMMQKVAARSSNGRGDHL